MKEDDIPFDLLQDFENNFEKFKERIEKISIKSTILKQLMRIGCDNGSLQAIEFLLQMKMNANEAYGEDQNTPLHLLAQNGKLDEEILKTLLNHKARLNDKNKLNKTPLHHSIQSDHLSISRLLLDQNSNPSVMDNRKNTPLHLALMKSQFDYPLIES